MAREPINAQSRWRLRQEPYHHHGPHGNPFNFLLYLRDQTDGTLYGSVLNTLNSGQVPICRDFHPGNYGTTAIEMRGNGPALLLMRDYDASISLGRKLVENFEIVERLPDQPLGDPAASDWLGVTLRAAFGDGWCGPGNPGDPFTRRRKQEIIGRALSLALSGWQGRVSLPAPSRGAPPLLHPRILSVMVIA
jgi:hypothetical protein